MTGEDYFSERYKSGKAPWEIGKPDFNLIEVVSQKPIPGCKALDIGCGTGDDAIWLAQQNFKVIGIDTSNRAIEKAREKADQSNVSCTFLVADFLHDTIDGLPSGLYSTGAVSILLILKMTGTALPKTSLFT